MELIIRKEDELEVRRVMSGSNLNIVIKDAKHSCLRNLTHENV